MNFTCCLKNIRFLTICYIKWTLTAVVKRKEIFESEYVSKLDFLTEFQIYFFERYIHLYIDFLHNDFIKINNFVIEKCTHNELMIKFHDYAFATEERECTICELKHMKYKNLKAINLSNFFNEWFKIKFKCFLDKQDKQPEIDDISFFVDAIKNLKTFLVNEWSFEPEFYKRETYNELSENLESKGNKPSNISRFINLKQIELYKDKQKSQNSVFCRLIDTFFFSDDSFDSLLSSIAEEMQKEVYRNQTLEIEIFIDLQVLVLNKIMLKGNVSFDIKDIENFKIEFQHLFDKFKKQIYYIKKERSIQISGNILLINQEKDLDQILIDESICDVNLTKKMFSFQKKLLKIIKNIGIEMFQNFNSIFVSDIKYENMDINNILDDNLLFIDRCNDIDNIMTSLISSFLNKYFNKKAENEQKININFSKITISQDIWGIFNIKKNKNSKNFVEDKNLLDITPESLFFKEISKIYYDDFDINCESKKMAIKLKSFLINCFKKKYSFLQDNMPVTEILENFRKTNNIELYEKFKKDYIEKNRRLLNERKFNEIIKTNLFNILVLILKKKPCLKKYEFFFNLVEEYLKKKSIEKKIILRENNEFLEDFYVNEIEKNLVIKLSQILSNNMLSNYFESLYEVLSPKIFDYLKKIDIKKKYEEKIKITNKLITNNLFDQIEKEIEDQYEFLIEKNASYSKICTSENKYVLHKIIYSFEFLYKLSSVLLEINKNNKLSDEQTQEINQKDKYDINESESKCFIIELIRYNEKFKTKIGEFLNLNMDLEEIVKIVKIKLIQEFKTSGKINYNNNNHKLIIKKTPLISENEKNYFIQSEVKLTKHKKRKLKKKTKKQTYDNTDININQNIIIRENKEKNISTGSIMENVKTKQEKKLHDNEVDISYEKLKTEKNLDNSINNKVVSEKFEKQCQNNYFEKKITDQNSKIQLIKENSKQIHFENNKSTFENFLHLKNEEIYIKKENIGADVKERKNEQKQENDEKINIKEEETDEKFARSDSTIKAKNHVYSCTNGKDNETFIKNTVKNKNKKNKENESINNEKPYKHENEFASCVSSKIVQTKTKNDNNLSENKSFFYEKLNIDKFKNNANIPHKIDKEKIFEDSDNVSVEYLTEVVSDLSENSLKIIKKPPVLFKEKPVKKPITKSDFKIKNHSTEKKRNFNSQDNNALNEMKNSPISSNDRFILKNDLLNSNSNNSSSLKTIQFEEKKYEKFTCNILCECDFPSISSERKGYKKNQNTIGYKKQITAESGISKHDFNESYIDDKNLPQNNCVSEPIKFSEVLKNVHIKSIEEKTTIEKNISNNSHNNMINGCKKCFLDEDLEKNNQNMHTDIPNNLKKEKFETIDLNDQKHNNKSKQDIDKNVKYSDQDIKINDQKFKTEKKNKDLKKKNAQSKICECSQIKINKSDSNSKNTKEFKSEKPKTDKSSNNMYINEENTKNATNSLEQCIKEINKNQNLLNLIQNINPELLNNIQNLSPESLELVQKVTPDLLLQIQNIYPSQKEIKVSHRVHVEHYHFFSYENQGNNNVYDQNQEEIVNQGNNNFYVPNYEEIVNQGNINVFVPNYEELMNQAVNYAYYPNHTEVANQSNNFVYCPNQEEVPN